MLIVVMMGRLMIAHVELSTMFWLYSVLDTVVISGEDVVIVWCLTLWLVGLSSVLCCPSF